MSRSRRTVREVVAGLFLAALAGVLVGCGGGEKPAAQPVAQNTTPEVRAEGKLGENKDGGADLAIPNPAGDPRDFPLHRQLPAGDTNALTSPGTAGLDSDKLRRLDDASSKRLAQF